MFRSSNKTNPGKKEKQQKKAKEEKNKKIQESLRLKEEERARKNQEMAIILAHFKPGKLYSLTTTMPIRIGQRCPWLERNTFVLLTKVKSDRHCYRFQVVYGEDVGELSFKSPIVAIKGIKPVDLKTNLG